jgi:hypothetical protein
MHIYLSFSEPTYQSDPTIDAHNVIIWLKFTHHHRLTIAPQVDAIGLTPLS